MDSFVIAGKAHPVFDRIELKAQREAELEKMMAREDGFDTACRYDPAWHCTCPESTCETLDCKPWRERKGV